MPAIFALSKVKIMSAVPLSPIDHVFTGTGSYPIEFVFEYAGHISAKELKSSLESVLKMFPPAQGSLEVGTDGLFRFNSSSTSWKFEEVQSDQIFSQTSERECFIDPVFTFEGEPLLRVRLSQTPTGSVLGVSFSHSVVDGFSYFYFLTAWAKQFHRKQVLPPSHERQLLIKTDTDNKAISAKDVLQKAGLFLDRERQDIDRDHLIWETISFSKAELAEMLESAQASCDVRLSYNDVIVAKLWQKYSEQWNKESENHDVYISCPFDFRRLLKEFPKNYFGNAVTLATTSIGIEQLKEASLADLALMIRKNISLVNESYINGGLSTLYGLNKQHGIKINESIHVAHPSSGLLVTNLSRLPVNEIEFDAGPPIRYEILTPANRAAVILPAEDGVQVRVCCPTD